MTDRYDASGSSEGQFQPGSNDQVLLNKLDLTDQSEMDEVELGLLDDITRALLDEVEIDQPITVDDVSKWHRRWLGNVYTWAGQFRSVNMGKDGFPFAAANLIPKLMSDFDENYLQRYTPCDGIDDEQLVEALATVHIEFILIHPYREGNGRLGRLLATIMALQAGKPPLDFTYLSENKIEYIQAIHTGLDNVDPMKALFRRVLQQSVLTNDNG